MDTVQSTQEKRTIKVKDFLDDFRSGMGDRELQTKYHLTQLGLEKFYSMLMDRGILSPQELQENYRGEEGSEKDVEDVVTNESSFICPQCLASHKTMFDICPSCGVSFQEMINQERTAGALPPAYEQATPEDLKDDSLNKTSSLEGIFTAVPEKAPARLDSSELPDSEFCGPPQPSEPRKLPATDTFARFTGLFKGTSEQADSGVPFPEPAEHAPEQPEVRCDGCDHLMERAVRDVYERANSIKVLMAAGGCFLLGFLATLGIHFFSGYSFLRLIVVYGTGLSLLFGSVLLAVGTFLYMAKEKVYYCPLCRRVYPRD